MITLSEDRAGREAARLVESLRAAGALTSGSGWLRAQREQALERFLALGLPTRRDELWRHTEIGALSELALHPAPTAMAARGAVDPPRLGDALRLLFIDGRFQLQGSHLGEVPGGLEVRGLADAAVELEGVLGSLADLEERPFTALNSAFWSGGLLLRVGRGVELERPIHILHIGGDRPTPAALLPRHLIHLEAGSRATIIEHYLGAGETPSLTNAVSEIFVGEGAQLEHLRLQEESPRAFHLGALDVHQEAGSRVVSHSIALGAQLSRVEVRPVLAGEGAECTLAGLYLGGEDRLVDHFTSIDHAASHTRSEQIYRGVVADRARAVFRGHILVRAGQSKIAAHQSDRNLLLSAAARVDAMPQLEINADDVTCTHGATIGHLDREALFYLRSRGIGAAAAGRLLTFAFANEVVQRIGFAPGRERIEEGLHQWLAVHRIEGRR